MDQKLLMDILEAQKQTLRAAQGRKGQRPTNKTPRIGLMMRFSQIAAQGPAMTGNIRTSLIGYAYPPSTTPLVDLKPMTISELRLETHHVGRVLIVRTFGQPIRFQSVQNGVEDMKFDVDQVAIYDASPNVPPVHVLPKNSVFAIKEPFYKTSASGDYIIRVDHPSDLIRLQPGHPMIPYELAPKVIELEQEAIEYKNVGNMAFKRKDFLSALDAYNQGLHASKDADSPVKFDLYRNRSIVNTHLQRFQQAAKDAIAAVIPDAGKDKKKTQDNVKALFRTARAFYCLEQFSSAQSYFDQLLQIAPGDKDGKEHAILTKARLHESTTGEYDFTAMSSSITASNQRLDYASFTANVAVRTAGKKGRGLFATCDIKAGELVLVEKAFCSFFKSEHDSTAHIVLNVNTNSSRIGSHVSLYFKLVQKTLHNSEGAKKVLELFDGHYTPKCTAPVVDNSTVVDTFQLAAILEHNIFGCPNTRSSDEDQTSCKATDGPSDSAGLWVAASYMNHACHSNARRSFLGDMMIVRAIKDIAKDEEILISYRNRESDHSIFQERLEKTWKFKCTCSICSAEGMSSGPHRKERARLTKDADAFLERNRNTLLVDNATLAQAKGLAKKLEETYDEKLFKNVPRLALARINAWLCSVYMTERTVHKIPEMAQNTLHNLGYDVKISLQTLQIDRTHAFFDGWVVDVAMYASHAAIDAGKAALGEQWEMFAKEGYLADKGEMRGFKERYCR